MSNIVLFIPKNGVTAQENINAFISATRPILSAYPGINSWDENTWDLAGRVEWRGRGKAKIAAVFSSHSTSGGVGETMMSQPFLDFAKSYFLYSQALRPTKAFFQRLAALRVLEHALFSLHDSSDISMVTPAVLNIADNLIKERFGDGARYRVGRELTAIANMISEKRLVSLPIQWKSKLSRPKEGNRTGIDADLKRKEKLPSQAALDALPKCFLNAESIPDIVISSVAALLCTAPDRASEVLSLPFDCEVEQIRNGKTDYGLRFWAGKGAGPMVKWIAPTMVDVARAAISKLRLVSQPAREIARWYERNPKKIYLSPEIEHLRANSFLSLMELRLILGFPEDSSARKWLDTNKIKLNKLVENNSVSCVKFSDVERIVISKLPKGFPFLDSATKIHYSDALLVLRLNEINFDKATYNCMIGTFSTSQLNDGLGAGIKHGKSSIFSRLGYTEEDDDQSPIKMHSHQFRHWLNTLAHRGGLSQLDIAKWSGRIDIQQNTTYNNMKSMDLIELTRTLTKNDPRLFGTLAELVVNTPVSRDEFMLLEFPTAHVTDIGFCVHDYTMLPCQKHRDCINCNKNVCVKGDIQKLKHLKDQLEIAEKELEKAREGIEEGYYGAERWFDHHSDSVNRLREVIRVYEDPRFPVGTVIRRYDPNEYSPVLLAIQDRFGIAASEAAIVIGNMLPTLPGGH